MFMVNELPEDERLDKRIDYARQSLIRSASLTPREIEVFDLLLAGLSRDDIAHTLKISPWTVKNHIHSIYTKAGVNSLKELLSKIYNGEMTPRG